MWSKGDNKKNYDKKRSDSDDEGEGSNDLEWRKDWHPEVQHYIHGGRGRHAKKNCDSDD